MPVIDLNNLNRRYGIKLPIPRIERIDVYPTYFNLKVALYFNIDSQLYAEIAAEFADYLSDILKDLKIYCLFVRDLKIATDEDYGSLGYDTNYYAPGDLTNRMARILGGQKSVWNYILGDEYTMPTAVTPWDYASSYSYDAGADWDDEISFIALRPFFGPDTGQQFDDSHGSNVVKFGFSDFELVDDSSDDTGSNVLKYTATTENIISDEDEAPVLQYILNPEYDTRVSVSMVAWTSLSDISRESITDEGGGGAWNELFAADDARAYLYDIRNSSITYQHIIKDGSVMESPDEIWVSPAAGPFVGIPLRSLDDLYYADNIISHDMILSRFENIIKAARSTNVIGSVVESLTKRVMHIVSIYKGTPDLIYRLDEYQKTMADKTNTSPAGRFHLALKEGIYSINASIKQGVPLHQQLISNPVVVDHTYETDYSGIGVDDGWDGGYIDDFIYYDATMMSREPEYPDGVFGEDAGTIHSTGYFFFDYEKALHTSIISRIADVNVINNMLGNEFINYYYLFNRVDVQHNRFVDSDTSAAYRENSTPEPGTIAGNELYSISTTFSQPPELQWDPSGRPTPGMWTAEGDAIYPSVHYPQIDETTPLDLSNDDEAWLAASGADAFYLRLRSFNVLDTDFNLENYRISCFEFYEYLNSNATLAESNMPNWDYYRFGVEMMDNTYMIYFHFKQAFEDTMTELENYLAYAEEKCAFDSASEWFNEFFRNAIVNYYSGNPSHAPWNRGPAVYWIHQEMWTRGYFFKGDLDKIAISARSLRKLVDPYTGTLEYVRTFVEMMRELHAVVYDTDSYIYRWVVSAVEDQSTTQLFGVDEFQTASGRAFVDVPTVPCGGWYYDPDIGDVFEPELEMEQLQQYLPESDPSIWMLQQGLADRFEGMSPFENYTHPMVMQDPYYWQYGGSGPIYTNSMSVPTLRLDGSFNSTTAVVSTTHQAYYQSRSGFSWNTYSSTISPSAQYTNSVFKF